MSVWRRLTVKHVTKKLIVRLGWLVGVFIAAWSIAMLLFARSAGDAKPHRLGSAYLGYDLRAQCVLIRDERSRVVDSGLIDGRGIAIADDDLNSNGTRIHQVLYVADAWQGVYRLRISNPPSLAAPEDGQML